LSFFRYSEDVKYIVKNEEGHLVADSHIIVDRWRKYFPQLFNVHGVKEVGQAEIQTAEPLVTEPSAFEILLFGRRRNCLKSGRS